MPKKPQRLAGEWDFVLPAEEKLDEAERGVFTVKALTQAERLRALDTRVRTELNDDGTIVSQSHAFRQAFEIVRDHLVKTANVPSDAPENWPGLAAPPEARELWMERNLDDFDILAIGTAIREASFLGEPVKNC